MNPQISRRIARALQTNPLPIPDRLRIARQAALVESFDELPKWIKDLVLAEEASHASEGGVRMRQPRKKSEGLPNKTKYMLTLASHSTGNERPRQEQGNMILSLKKRAFREADVVRDGDGQFAEKPGGGDNASARKPRNSQGRFADSTGREIHVGSRVESVTGTERGTVVSIDSYGTPTFRSEASGRLVAAFSPRRLRVMGDDPAPKPVRKGPAPKPVQKPETPFSKGLEAFAKAGGSVSVVPNAQAKAILSELDSLMERMGGPDSDFARDDRVVFARAAIEEASYDPDAILLVGRDKKLGISAAMVAYQRHDPDYNLKHLYVERLGSTGITPGAGTALAVEAARMAQAQGMIVLGQPTPTSAPFWRKLGWHEDPTGQGVGLYGWNRDDLKKVTA
jgi:hypothetical protein